MTDIDGPRLATKEEFPEMMELLDRYFSYERGGMAARLPYSYDPSRIEYHAIIRVDGQIISHVGAFPQTLVIGDEEIECWGFGGVATHRRHRGNGYMSKLLEFWFDKMENQGVPLAELSGNRQRYNHFGWEAAGREFQYEIHNRSFAGTIPEHGRIKTYDSSDEHLETLHRLHSRETFRVKRNHDQSRIVFGQRGLETLLYEHGGDATYVSLSRESRERTIAEFGGSEEGIEALLAHLFEAYDINKLTVVVPPQHSLNPTFRRHSRTWSMKNHRNMKICDLEATLNRFSKQMERRWQTFEIAGSGSLSLGIQDTNEAVRITYSQDRVDIDPINDEPEILLNRRDMVALLFGLHDRQRELKDRHPFLTTVLPLDFFIWQTEHV